MRINQETYARPDVVADYSAARGLHVAEERLLGHQDLSKARLLDLGVGGGRTCGPLSAVVAAYVGLDYSVDMVRQAQARHPGLWIEQGDARDLRAFETGAFDVVLFSFNGLDYVDHEDRLRTLAEIRRVLRPGGTLIFSSHNRDYEWVRVLPWRRRWDQHTLSRSLHALRYRTRRREMRALERVTAEYSLVNDDAHDYSLLTYYIAASDQIQQLHRAGFEQVRVYDQWGRPTVLRDIRSAWKYYVGVRS